MAQMNKPHAVHPLRESRQSPPQERAPIGCEEPATARGQRQKPAGMGESAGDGLDGKFAASASSLDLPNSTPAAQEHHLKS